MNIKDVLVKEGGYWLPFKPGVPIHAFRTTDGRIWDVVNGWRSSGPGSDVVKDAA